MIPLHNAVATSKQLTYSNWEQNTIYIFIYFKKVNLPT